MIGHVSATMQRILALLGNEMAALDKLAALSTFTIAQIDIFTKVFL